MKNKISLIVGGIQGEGVISTGTNLMKALSNIGYYTYGKRNFSSRIKGGNNAIIIHVNTSKVMCAEDQWEIMLAFDIDTIQRYQQQLKVGGVVLYDAILGEDFTHYEKYNYIPLPISEIAKGVGSPLIKTTVALGFLGQLLGIEAEHFVSILEKIYGRKGPEVLQKNREALQMAISTEIGTFLQYKDFMLEKKKNIARPIMMGNDAISIGAIAAGCRFIASYPITPASEIMENLSKMLPQYQGLMLQAEDEIAAINMVTGASYAGVRSMTATSGPGLSLMMEGIGLAATAEIPIVLVNAQRVGPSTGLPTKHEQSDLLALYYGGHGEFPLIILSPSSVEECFEATIRAFNLAEKYQCPVVILSDLSLSLSMQTIDELDEAKINIDRGKILATVDQNQAYKRYAFTEDLISPRALPGTAGGMHHITGLEHNELGYPSDDPINRRQMMEKRLNKVIPLEEEPEIKITENGSRFLLLCFGSTYGIIKEAVERLNHAVDYGNISMIKPLPKKQLIEILEKYDTVLIVENNFCKQLASIIKSELGYHHKIKSMNQYDGTPFSVSEVMLEIGGLVNGKYEGLS